VKKDPKVFIHHILESIMLVEKYTKNKTQAQFECVSCGYKNHADVVGAINILERGHRLLACGESVVLNHSKKQEPAEVSQLAFN